MVFIKKLKLQFEDTVIEDQYKQFRNTQVQNNIRFFMMIATSGIILLSIANWGFNEILFCVFAIMFYYYNEYS